MLENSTVVVSEGEALPSPSVVISADPEVPGSAGPSAPSNPPQNLQVVVESKDVKIVTNEGASTFYVNRAMLKAKAPRLYNRVTNEAEKENFSKLKINPALFSFIIDYINGSKTEQAIVAELNKKSGQNAIESTIELLILVVQLSVCVDNTALVLEIVRFVTRNPAAMNPSRAVMIINYCENFLESNDRNSGNVDTEIQDKCKSFIGDILTKAWNFFRYFTVDCLNNTSSADILKVTPQTLTKIINIRWLNVSEDSLFTFLNKWIELHLLSPSDPERMRIFGNVDMYRLSGSLIVGAAKHWIESQSTSECDMYVTVMEKRLMKDTIPLPPPLRIHGFFAIGSAAPRNPVKGFKLVNQQTFARFFNLLTIQIRNDGGAIPLLDLFPVSTNVVTVSGRIPMAVPNEVYGSTKERLTVKRVFFADNLLTKKEEDDDNDKEGSIDYMKSFIGWAAVNFGEKDIVECASKKAEDWMFDIPDVSTQASFYALYMIDNILPL